MRPVLRSAHAGLMFWLGALAVFGEASVGEGASLESAPNQARQQISLSEGWLVKQLANDNPDVDELTRESAAPGKAWLSARMPAQVHDVLLAHALIPDPHIDTNAAVSAWVGEKAWAYVCRFATPSSISGQAFLRFAGLDTLARAWLNGAPIGAFENMFREYAVRVDDQLVSHGQTNVLVLVFSSPLQYLRSARLPPGNPERAPHQSLRKCHSDFSSYLGARPHAVKVGVYRDVILDLPAQCWIEDVCVRAALSRNLRFASINVRVETAGSKAEVHWTLRDPSGRQLRAGTAVASPTIADFVIGIRDPQLWWPRMDGPQPLYTMEVALRSAGHILDHRRTQLGIREVKPVLRDPATGEKRFCFQVNGRPIFLRGGNWVPLEGATHVWQPERARQLLDLAEHANMNMLRLWGEGVLPPPSFYEECDRRGICLWQDFMFGYYDHAKDDVAFLDNCRAEIEGTIRRLRNHASVLLWSGGNEQYLWTPTQTVSESKRAIFERLMPDACRRLDPTRLFHTSSPYGGSPTGNWPLEGDWHDYTTINFAPEASVPLFGSEVLRASPPSLASMRRFLTEEELWPKGFDPAIRKPGQPAWPPAWAYHSTGIATWDRVGPVHEYCDPSNAAELIRILGTAHGEYLRDRVERERRGIPDGGPTDRRGISRRRCWGNLVWRLNDSWPMIYGSMVDYYLEPKIAYYSLRRAYEPVLMSFERTPDRIHTWVINDSPQLVSGTLVVQRLGFAGRILGTQQAPISVGPGEAHRCLDTTPLGEISLRNEFLHATFAGHQSTCLLIGERYLHLPPARLTARLAAGRVEISTDSFARQVTLELEGATGAAFEDNYFDLPPAAKRSLAILNAAGGRTLIVHALNSERVTLTLAP